MTHHRSYSAGRRHRPWTLRLASVLVALAGLSGISAVCGAEGLEATVDRVWIRGDSLKVDFELTGLFSEHVRDGLSRGLPMTYSFEIQLWRERSGWWDALESQVVRQYKIQRNVWDDRYFLVSPDGNRLWLQDLDALERHLSQRRGELVAMTGEMDADAEHYVAVLPSLQPLTIADIREVEAWLTGEIDESRKRDGVSTVTGLPRIVLGVFIDLSGLGDKSTVARSGIFRLGPPRSPGGPDSTSGDSAN